LGINEGTLGHWANKHSAEHPVTEELSLPDRAKLKELERDDRDLRLQHDFLTKAVGSVKYTSAQFADHVD
jgi:transposase